MTIANNLIERNGYMEQEQHVWSPYQSAFFECIATGAGHVVVIARAGSGKTTTAVEALNHVSEGKSVLLCAFNKSIATELEGRAPGHVTVKTLHALGYAAIRKTWGPHVRPSGDRDRAILDSILPQILTYEDRGNTRSLVKFAKAFMVDSDEDLNELLYQHGLGIQWEYYRDDKGQMPPSFGFKEIDGTKQTIEAEEPAKSPINPYDLLQFQWVRAALEKACTPSAEITFDDMVYAPAKLRMRTGSFDYVFVDETQDMDRGQLTLARNALKPGGRLVVIGDDRQAIYSFRGADHSAIDNMITELSATVLTLPVSYRCPSVVAQLVRKYVPDFKTPLDAKEGQAQEVTIQQAQGMWSEGDFVLSRANAPLVKLCLAALSGGTRAFIQGRDIGAGLTALIKKSTARDIPELCRWLATWEQSEVARLTAANKEHLVEGCRDRAAALVSMTEGLSSIAELFTRIEKVFSDTGGARLMFSSVHRAKGLEANRVWVLKYTFQHERDWRIGTPSVRILEEQNLWYVAITRTREFLYLVNG